MSCFGCRPDFGCSGLTGTCPLVRSGTLLQFWGLTESLAALDSALIHVCTGRFGVHWKGAAGKVGDTHQG